MKKCLILLTSEYPFGFGEPFLETEIRFHEQNFEKIIIFAIDVNNNLKSSRNVSENTDVYNLSDNMSKKVGRAFDAMCGGFNAVFKPVDDEEKSSVLGNIKKRVFLEYFKQRTQREYKYCSAILDRYDFSQYDCVTIYSYWLFVTAMIGVKIREKLKTKYNKNIKFISRAHRYDLYSYANSLNYLPCRQYLLKNCDRVYPCSIDGEKYLNMQTPGFNEKIMHSYLGTLDHGINELKDDGSLNIVSCSRVTEVKRIDRIVDSLALLKDMGIKKIKWVHIGFGEMSKSIMEMAKEKLGFMEVAFLGQLENSEVYDFYLNNSVDMVVNTSDSEGLPVSIIEAMSFGIIATATDVGGESEIIKDGVNGYLVNKDFNNNELAQKIYKYYTLDYASKCELRKNARDFWQNHFNAEKNYSDFSKEIIYDEKVLK